MDSQMALLLFHFWVMGVIWQDRYLVIWMVCGFRMGMGVERL